MILEFELHVDNTRLAEILHISSEAWPEISIVNKFQCFLTEMVG